MDKLDSSNLGGHPFALNDLEFAQNSLADAIKGFASILDNSLIKAVVLSGIELTNPSGSNWQWTDGYVWISGEVYKVAAGTVALAGGQVLTWNVVASHDPAGDILYENTVLVHAYITRRATIVSANPTVVLPGSAYVPKVVDTPGFLEALLPSSDWNYVSDSGQPAFGTGGWGNATGGPVKSPGHVRYRLDRLRYIELDGDIQTGSYSNTTNKLFTLPLAPTALKTFNQPGGTVTIAPNGDVVAYGTNGQPVNIALNGVRFSLD